jgi:ribosomal protein L44E
MEETVRCERCGAAIQQARMKEVMFEEGRARVTRRLCPSCLDQVMHNAEKVRGIVGDEKSAAIHISPPPQ